MADIVQNPALLSISEGRRKLQSLAFAQSSQMTLQIPCDTVVKRMEIRFSGNVTTTYASGTPVADALSTFDNLVSNTRLVVDGATTVKSTRPYMLRQNQLLMSGVLAERKASAGAAAASFNNPTADAGFTYGTTTQITTVAESFVLFFQMPSPWVAPEDRESTYLNLKGRSTCELTFNSRAYSSLLGFGNTAPVVYSADDFRIDVTLVEDRSMPREKVFLDYIQTNQQVTHSAAASEMRFRLPVSQWLAGLSILTRDGAAGSATTASGKLLNSNVMSNVQLAVNGTNVIQQTTFQAIQAQNRQQFGVVAPFGSNVSLFDGFAFLNLLQNGKLASALDCRKSQGVDNVEVVYDLNGSPISYTNPISIDFETHEIRQRT
jgi:hypothetical protein